MKRCEHHHSFRFMDDSLNRKLIKLLQLKARGRFEIQPDGTIRYPREEEDLIGNDVICAVRNAAFPTWQVLSCPADWIDSYRSYMAEKKIPYREEIRDRSLRLLIPRNYRPHSWKLQDPQAASRKMKAVI
jgi:hypothetical protein